MKKAFLILCILMGLQALALLLMGGLAYSFNSRLLILFFIAAPLFILADIVLWSAINKNIRLVSMELELEKAEEQKILEKSYRERQLKWRKSADLVRVRLYKQLSRVSRILEEAHLRDEETDSESRVKALLDDMETLINESKETHCCDHLLSNIILSEKLEEARNKQIDMKIQTAVPDNLPLADSEWCSLWCNLLDNAVEGCERIPEGRRWINVKAALLNGFFYIKTENSVDPDKISATTSKLNRERHGFGLMILKELAHKYGGNVIFKQDSESYTVIFTIAGSVRG